MDEEERLLLMHWRALFSAAGLSWLRHLEMSASRYDWMPSRY